MNTRPMIAAAVGLLLSGCQTNEPLRYEAIGASAGNAIAANTVMQMVDPWPAGVEETNLVIPADHDQYRREPVNPGESESRTTDY